MPLTLLFTFQCIPLQKNWETVEEVVPGDCMSKKAVEKIIIVQGGKSTEFSRPTRAFVKRR